MVEEECIVTLCVIILITTIFSTLIVLFNNLYRICSIVHKFVNLCNKIDLIKDNYIDMLY